MFKKIFTFTVLLLSCIMTAQAQTGTWSGKLEIQGTSLPLVFHLNDENPTMDSPEQGVKGIPVKIERGSAGKIVITIPSLDASYEGQWLIRQIAGTFKQMNVSLPLTLTPGEDKPNRPQTPVGPFPYTTQEVSFNNADVILNGTLTLPEGYSNSTPALIMVTGSGVQNRDEEIFEHKPFAVIADAFARAGIATLRYDDRGFHGYAGNLSECTVNDFKKDALAGMNLLRERFNKVGVIGHSEGGTIAMMLAAEKEADFIISLAGMAVSGAETLIKQNRSELLEAGISEETTERYCDLLKAAFDATVHGGQLPKTEKYDLPEALIQNYHQAVQTLIRTPYIKSFLGLDMRPLLEKITCPVLAINGTKDTQVDCSSNLEAISNGLTTNPASVIKPVDGLNHLFQHCSTGDDTEYRKIEETFAPEVLEMMKIWVMGLN